MFDPTIYENIKVVIQGAVYDLDISGKILITDRNDWVDLSRMSRSFSIEFREKIAGNATATLQLNASFAELAAEIHEIEPHQAGSQLYVIFNRTCSSENENLRELHEKVQMIWGSRPQITHQWIKSWGIDDVPSPLESITDTYEHRMVLNFNRRINENQISDIPEILQFIVDTLEVLNSHSLSLQ